MMAFAIREISVCDLRKCILARPRAIATRFPGLQRPRQIAPAHSQVTEPVKNRAGAL